MARRAKNAYLVVVYNSDRHLFQQGLHAPFAHECLEKFRALQTRQDARSDSSAQEYASYSQQFQRQISGFRAVLASGAKAPKFMGDAPPGLAGGRF